MIKAKDIMTKEVITVSENTSIKELSELFIKHRVNGFPVVDDSGLLAGIVTEKNLIEQSKNLHIPTVIALFDAVIYLESDKKFEDEVKRYNATQVKDIYTSKVKTVSPDADIQDVASLMAEKGIHSLPVVENNKILGIIGKLDIIKGMAQT
ncbi:MAG: CBS domain-containing protein [Nitrospinota bacterium]|nr:CBS domain-containing protein [Nitrospinota bacterium]